MTADLPPVPPARPPVPAWMWLLFAVVALVVGAFVSIAVGGFGTSNIGPAILAGLLSWLCLAVPFLGGLALAGRFFVGTGGRIAGGLIFAGLLTVGLGAVVCAGCMCLFPDSLNLH